MCMHVFVCVYVVCMCALGTIDNNACRNQGVVGEQDPPVLCVVVWCVVVWCVLCV